MQVWCSDIEIEIMLEEIATGREEDEQDEVVVVSSSSFLKSFYASLFHDGNVSTRMSRASASASACKSKNKSKNLKKKKNRKLATFNNKKSVTKRYPSP